MAKFRMVNTKFWDDSYVVELDPIEKLLFLYLLTNPLTNVSGVYELPLKRVAFDTGIDKEMIEKIVKRFEGDGKVVHLTGWIGIKNFIRHQSLNTNVKKGISVEIAKAPPQLLERLGIDFQSLGIPVESPCLNLNTNLNPNFNETSERTPKISFPQKTVDCGKSKSASLTETVFDSVKKIRSPRSVSNEMLRWLPNRGQ